MNGRRRGPKYGDVESTVDPIVLFRRVKLLLIVTTIALLMMTMLWNHDIFEVEEDGVRAEVEKETKRNIASSHYVRAPANAPMVAIVSCIKQKGYQDNASFLERSLLPSIYDTITPEERSKFRVELILGYDHDDTYWQQEEHHRLSPRGWNKGQPTSYTDHEPIPVSFLSIHKDPNGERPNRIPFNELCRAAYDYGATYIVRINDDTEFMTKGWITVATNALSKFNPPNVGVVGPTCHEGNQAIMTHDMVHAPTHYKIFDTYYPKEFDNYYVDDWISNVYGEDRTKQLVNWEVKHHLTTFWTRYEPTFHQDKLLNQSIAEGHNLMDAFVGGNRKIEKKNQFRVLGTNVIESADGPIQKLHLALEEESKL